MLRELHPNSAKRMKGMDLLQLRAGFDARVIDTGSGLSVVLRAARL